MDFVQTLDPSKLVLVGAGLAFVLASGVSPSYNLPILLFGCYVHENNEAVQSFQLFTALLGVSAFFDIIWMMNNEQHGLFKVLTFLLLLLKVPMFFSFAMALRQRGGHLGLNLGAANLSGPTVWSMPGGFTSNGREGYQNLDDDNSTPFVRASRPPAPPTAPPHRGPPQPSKMPEPTAPGGYQDV
ncbi:hypothetical protein CPB83DRAFT_857842 [Crepidotus variabilis]|uniref:Uncharacterized protein n=1 Tax=Crepidotus variabilis TaxID=179855 RepID=A0A9P6ECD4_9AGAR|nr:hypothetical protein CPB83DRAFT_857842 [Crepidotus variabilis]